MRKIIKNKNLVPVTIADLNLDDSPDLNSTDPVTSRGVATAITEAVGGASDALQEQIDDIAEKAGSGYIPNGEASVATLNGLSGQENGWLYTMTDAGTITDGSLAVVAGDTVAWDATNSVWYKAMDYAPRRYGTNEVHNLPTTITAFRTGDVIPVDGPDGTAKMSKEDLLRVTAENAVASGIAGSGNVQDNLVKQTLSGQTGGGTYNVSAGTGVYKTYNLNVAKGRPFKVVATPSDNCWNYSGIRVIATNTDDTTTTYGYYYSSYHGVLNLVALENHKSLVVQILGTYVTATGTITIDITVPSIVSELSGIETELDKIPTIQDDIANLMTQGYRFDFSGSVPSVDLVNGNVVLGAECIIYAKNRRIDLSSHDNLKIDGKLAFHVKNTEDSSLSLSTHVVIFYDSTNDKWFVCGQDKYSTYATKKDLILIGAVHCNYGATYTANSIDWVNFPFETDFWHAGIRTGILDFNPASEVEPRIRNLAHRMWLPGGFKSKQLILCHLTDIHGDGTNLKRILDFKTKYSTYITDVIHTGDSLYDRWSDSFDFWANAGANNVLNVLGNHDVNFYDADNNPVSVTQLEVYNRFFAPFIGDWGVVQPTGAAENGLMYYYKDYSDQGIRLVVLDEYHYDASQETWVSDVLDDARTNNLAVVLVRHQPYAIDKFANCSFVSIENHGSNVHMASLLTLVDSFVSAGGEFVMWLCGHTHQDYSGTIQGHSTQFQFAGDIASMNHINWGNEWRETGKKCQDCFTLISVDRYEKVARFARIGSNIDRYQRSKIGFAVKYDTGTMIWCS